MGIASIRKALVAALVAGVGALQIAFADESVTQIEWYGIGLAALVALVATYSVANKQAPTE